MKIINKTTGETLASIIANHGMTIEEACALAEIKIMRTEEDYDLGEGYDIDEIDLEY